MAPDAMILVFWKLSFKPTFSLSSFTCIKRLFSSSSLSAIWVVSSSYLRLSIYLLEVLIPACTSSSLALHMMYSEYKLNMQGDNIQPWHTDFLIWHQSAVPCPVQIVASWPAYRFPGGTWGGLVFPSPKEFSMVCCDPHSQNFPRHSIINSYCGLIFCHMSCKYISPISLIKHVCVCVYASVYKHKPMSTHIIFKILLSFSFYCNFLYTNSHVFALVPNWERSTSRLYIFTLLI